MHLFFFSFQRTLLSYLSASLTFKDTTKIRYIFISNKCFYCFFTILCVKVFHSSLTTVFCLLPAEIKVLLKTSNFAIKNVTLCPYSKMYLL